MTDRLEIQELLRKLYSARMRSDLAAIEQLFCANAQFRILGASQRSPVSILADGTVTIRETLALLLRISKLQAFEQISMIIDGDSAAVQWRAIVHSRVTPGPISTEFVDIIKIPDRQISSYTELFAPQAFARASTQPRMFAVMKPQ